MGEPDDRHSRAHSNPVASNRGQQKHSRDRSMKTNVLSPNPQLIRSRIGKVCVAIIGTTVSEMIERASAAIKETNFIEFRLDYLDKPAAALPKLKQFLTENTATTAIATCRRSANGGKFDGTVSAEAEILAKAATSGFQLID